VFGWFVVPAVLEFDKHQTDMIGLLHLLAAWALMGLAGMHAAAALKHHVIDRDNTLTRMLGLSRTTTSGNPLNSKQNNKERTL